MSKIISILNKEHIRVVSAFSHTQTILITCCLTLLFSIFYKPYILSKFDFDVLFFTMITNSLLIGLGVYVSRKIMKPHSRANWTYLMMFSTVNFSIFLAWLFCSIYNVLILNKLITFFFGSEHLLEKPKSFLFDCFIYFFATGWVFYGVLRLYDLSILLYTNKDSHTKTYHSTLEPKIILEGKNKDEKIELSKDQLIYVKSEGHYVNINYLDNNKEFCTKVIRTTISNIAKKTENYHDIIRCHRSYIVNTSYLNSLTEINKKTIGILRNNLGEISISKEHQHKLQQLIDKNSTNH